MTTVVHVTDEYDVYIGRGLRGIYPQSKWHNPFRIGPDGTREQVIEKYRNYIICCVDLLASLDELKDKRLGCWCHPKACHGDVLVELIGIFC